MLYRSRYRTSSWEMFIPTPTCNIADALDKQPQISDIVNNTTLGIIAADIHFLRNTRWTMLNNQQNTSTNHYRETMSAVFK